jgi:membrane associated rhomboid family serine protease
VKAPATCLLLLLNVAVFGLELSQPTLGALTKLVESWGMVPREYSLGQDLAPDIALPFWITMVTSTFLHAGWFHLGSNMIYLWVLGLAVEPRLGPARFLGAYLLCGAVAGLAHAAAYPDSMTPTVGASGGVSAIVAVYLSLLRWRRPLPARVGVPALLLAGLWVINVACELALGWQADQVASFAHLGGFLIGSTVGAFEGSAALRDDDDLRVPLPPQDADPDLVVLTLAEQVDPRVRHHQVPDPQGV